SVLFFQAEDGIRDLHVTGVQTCALPISPVPTPEQPVAEPLPTAAILAAQSPTPKPKAGAGVDTADRAAASSLRVPAERLDELMEIGRASCREGAVCRVHPR